MPINYEKGIINEHLHVRNNCGIFDVSHMGQILISLTNVNKTALENFIPLDFSNIILNKCYYSFILNSNAGIVDDIMLSKITLGTEEKIYIVYNSSRKNILNEIFRNSIKDFEIIQDRCLIAIQGPKSFLSIKSLISIPKKMKFLDIDVLKYENSEIYISRTGYTGEDGFEISIKNKYAEKLVKNILEKSNSSLCGLGCRDSLRVEAGLSLYGNEINEKISPIQAGLSWALDKNRLLDNKLNCSKILYDELNSPLKIKKIALSSVNKIMLRNNMILYNKEHNGVGYITSGCYSPILKKSIALGYIDKISEISDTIFVNVRNKFEELKLEKIPFIKKKYKKGDVND